MIADKESEREKEEEIGSLCEAAGEVGGVRRMGATEGLVLVSGPTACALNSGEYQLFCTDKSLLQNSRNSQNKIHLFISPCVSVVSLSLSVHFHFESLYFLCVCVCVESKLCLYFSWTSASFINSYYFLSKLMNAHLQSFNLDYMYIHTFSFTHTHCHPYRRLSADDVR